MTFCILFAKILNVVCGCSSMVRIPAFQAGCVGSIPIICSIQKPVEPTFRGLFLWIRPHFLPHFAIPDIFLLPCLAAGAHACKRMAGPFYFLLFFALPFPKCAPFPAALSAHGRAFSPGPLQIENRANACYTVT